MTVEWVWKRLAQYVRTTTTIEFSGISADALLAVVHEEAIERLKWVEAIVLSEELSNDEKVQAIQVQFLNE